MPRPRRAWRNKVIEQVRGVTDKPIKHVVLSHYHAVRVLGASAYEASEIIMSKSRPRHGGRARPGGLGLRIRPLPPSVPGARIDPRPHLADPDLQPQHEPYLGKRRVDLMWLGRAHTAGDIVAYVPDANVMFTGDIVEYNSACYCGDGHFHDWPATLDAIRGFDPQAIAPGRGDALAGGQGRTRRSICTADFVAAT